MATNIMSRNTRPNPYVGPRSFRTNERLYGRDTETRKLANLLGAERIVLLHSPSGAGKTSLIQAALIPRMQKRKFHVRPVARVNREIASHPTPSLPEGESVSPLPRRGAGGEVGSYNRYIFSLLSSLEDDQPENARTSDEELAGLTLAAYLEQRPKPENRKFELFIFDQFEEIVTLNPADQAAKRDFFAQLGEALENRSRWALFAMREDFLGALDPYALPIPNRLSVTFRLDLLGVDAACQAIRKPVPEGVTFDEAAARELADDLRAVQVQQPDGTFETQLGPHVEPVQLQVVCYRLWDSLTPDDMRIDHDDLAALGDVGHALADYYAQRVAAIANEPGVRESGVSERAIREWFDRKLITEQGIRTPVLMGIDQSEGLPNEVVRKLENTHLVRAEKRGGATWYELAHDRLVEPIRLNNSTWFETHLSPLQRQTALWDKQERSNQFLWLDEQLQEVEIWATEHQKELTPIECSFLEACREVVRAKQVREELARAQRERKTNQIIRVLALVSIVIMCIAVYFFFEARKEAARVERISFIQNLSFQAVEQPDELGAILARQAYLFQQKYALPLEAEVDLALRKVLQPPYFVHTLDGQDGHTEEVRSVAFSPDGRFLASASWDKRILLWNLKEPTAQPKEIGNFTMGLWAVAFSPDSKVLVSGNDDGIKLWDSEHPAEPFFTLKNQESTVLSLAIHDDNRWLAAGMDDGGVELWDLDARRLLPLPPSEHGGSVKSVAFSSDGKWLASASNDATIRLWNLSSSTSDGPIKLTGHTTPVSSVAFSPNGQFLASGSEDSTIRLWDLTTSPPIVKYTLTEHTGKILSLAFSPDETTLVSSSEDGTVRLWNIQSPQPDAKLLPNVIGAVYDLEFEPNSKALALGMADGSIQVWETQTTEKFPRLLSEHKSPIHSVAFDPQGNWLASGGGDLRTHDYTVRLWDLSHPEQAATPLAGHTALVNSLAFSPTENLLASASHDGTLRLWDPQAPEKPVKTWKTEQEELFYALSFSPDGQILAAVNDYGIIQLWRTESFQSPLKGYPWKHDGPIFSLAFSPDGNILASGSADRTVRLWDLRTPHEAPTILSDDGMREISTVTFHPTGKFVAAAGADRIIRVWNVNTEKMVGVFRGHTSAILSIAISPDGTLIASASYDHTVRIWDFNRPEARPLIIPHESDVVLAVDFSPDSKTLAMGTDDHKLLLWPVFTQALADVVCQKSWRNLTAAEWEQFIGKNFNYQKTCPNLPSGIP